MQFNKSIQWSYDPFIHRTALAKPLFALRDNWKGDTCNCIWQQNILKNIADIRFCVVYVEMALSIQFSSYSYTEARTAK